MNINFIKLGARVKEYRIKQGLTQEKLAEKVGVNETYISRVETGSAKPSLKLLFNLSIVLETTMDNLIVDSKLINENPTDKSIEEMLLVCNETEKIMIKGLIATVLQCRTH